MRRTTTSVRRCGVENRTTRPDSWAGGDRYEAYVGRWSRPVARRFVADLPVAPGARGLDVGCGTGALSATILATTSPSAVLGVDPSPDFVAHASAHVPDPRA